MEVTRADGSAPPGTGEGRKESKRRKDVPGVEDAAPAGERPDAVSISGLPVDMLTPEVRRVVDAMVGEIERLRRELEFAAGREDYLKELVDNHPFLPVLNRRAFLRELGNVLAHAEFLKTPACLLCLHLVNGEEVRRRLGRQVLDRALAHLCAALLGALHPTDIVGNLGSNDFGVILLIGDPETVVAKEAAVVEAIHLNPLHWRKKTVPLEVVTGTRVLEVGVSPEVVLAEADRDLIARLPATEGG